MKLPSSFLEATYIHSQGIGRTTEQRLWDAGAENWTDFLSKSAEELPLTERQYAMLLPTVAESLTRLEQEDFSWFAQRLPQGEHWRAVPSFGHRIAFLDIETNGGMNPDDLTVVGLFDGRTMHQFIQGKNLDELPEAVLDCSLRRGA